MHERALNFLTFGLFEKGFITRSNLYEDENNYEEDNVGGTHVYKKYADNAFKCISNSIENIVRDV